jgi:hypothetical protein
MVKRALSLFLAALILVSCVHVVLKKTYTVSGTISDCYSNDSRLLFSGVNVKVTDNRKKVILDGPLPIVQTIPYRYSLTGIPSGEYDFAFGGEYYDVEHYNVKVTADKNLDVVLSPKDIFEFDTDRVFFKSRDKVQEFSVTNVSGKELPMIIHADPRISAHILNITPQSCTLAPGETKLVTIKISRLRTELGLTEGSLSISDNNDWDYISIPVAIETTRKDYMAKLVGTVSDVQGNPLKDVLIYGNGFGKAAFTDENGFYCMDEIPYRSSFFINALSEFHEEQTSGPHAFSVDDTEIDFTLVPCQYHLSLDLDEIDFGTGSVSQSHSPETIVLGVTSNNDVQLILSVQVRDSSSFEQLPVPGLSISPATGLISTPFQIVFQLYRNTSNVGNYNLTVLLKTDYAGAYLLPLRINNIP